VPRDLPNVPGKMLTSAENHATLAISSALKSLCRGWTVAFVDARYSRRSRKDCWVVVRDKGSHVARRRSCGRQFTLVVVVVRYRLVKIVDL
jgi:hypothetical protein